LEPGYGSALNNLGLVLKRLGRIAEGIECLHQAVTLSPNVVDLQTNLASALIDYGDLAAARPVIEAVLKVDQDNVDPYILLGNLETLTGNLSAARQAYDKAVEIAPEDSNAQYSLALLLLLMGDFANGWQAYEARWNRPDFTSTPRNFGVDRWDGGPLGNRTLLIHAEQGAGDTIQFCRLVHDIRRQHPDARIILEVDTALSRLCAHSFAGNAQVFSFRDPAGSNLPKFDTYIPVISAAGLLGTDLDTLPGTLPYLTPPPDEATYWQKRMTSSAAGLNIGVVWAGKPTHRRDSHRSITAGHLAPLFELDGTNWFSLQVGHGALQKPLPGLSDLAPMLLDFAATAGAVSALDLVISVDTSVAHLAGAMGKRVWTLLPFIPDWRWLVDRGDSPWYPSMRLYRQLDDGDWATVIERVRSDLAAGRFE